MEVYRRKHFLVSLPALLKVIEMVVLVTGMVMFLMSNKCGNNTSYVTLYVLPCGVCVAVTVVTYVTALLVMAGGRNPLTTPTWVKGIYGKVGSENDIEALQRHLYEFHKWSEDWQMLFNIDKCKTLHVGHNNPHYNYQISSIILQQSDEEKDLEVNINHSLKIAQVGVALKKI